MSNIRDWKETKDASSHKDLSLVNSINKDNLITVKEETLAATEDKMWILMILTLYPSSQEKSHFYFLQLCKRLMQFHPFIRNFFGCQEKYKFDQANHFYKLKENLNK